MEKHKATLEDKRIAQEFRRFVYERPLNGIFTLWNLQGALRFANQGIPSKQEIEPYDVLSVLRWR